MGFEFSLQGLLRVRESFEKKEKQKLAVAMGELKRLSANLEKVRKEMKSAADRLSGLLARGTTGADLHLSCLERVLLERREQAFAECVSAALKDVQDQQIRFREAKQKRKVLDDLREKQLALYLLKEGRKEQQRLDDAFLLRRIPLHTGKSVA